MTYVVDVLVRNPNRTTQGGRHQAWTREFTGEFAEQDAHRYAQDQVESKGAFTATVEKR